MMLSQYKRYKAHVAPIYQSEIDRHLFATASFRRQKKVKSGSNWRSWLRGQWLRLVARLQTSVR
jgi:hypothetical protein